MPPAAAKDHLAQVGHPFSGSYCLCDGNEEEPADLTPRHRSGSNGNGNGNGMSSSPETSPEKLHGGEVLQLPSSLVEMLVEMQDIKEGANSANGTPGKAGAAAGDWKSKFGNFFKKMTVPNKNAEYAARLKTYAQMLHEYDDLLRQVHDVVQSRFEFLQKLGNEVCAKVHEGLCVVLSCFFAH